MTEELKEQIHERVYNIKVPTLGFSRRDLFNIAMEYAEPREKRIADLEAQIERMKCCGNCENGELSAHEEPCRHCQRCFASKDVTDQENIKDNWEVIKEIKEK